MLRISGLLPSGLDVGPLLREAKRQLHAEADYLGEGVWLRRYAGLLADAPEFMLPEVYDDMTTESVLAMSCMGGVPVSYTHLDVYKRQASGIFAWAPCIGCPRPTLRPASTRT